MMTLKQFVKELMAKQGLKSVRDLAKAMNVSHHTAWGILSGRTNFDLQTVQRIAQWSGAPIPAILEMMGIQMDEHTKVQSWLALVMAQYPELYELLNKMMDAHHEGKLTTEDVRAAFEYAYMKLEMLELKKSVNG